MNSKAFPRFVGQALSLVLCAALLAGPGAHAAVAPDSSRSAAAPARLAALSGPVADFAAIATGNPAARRMLAPSRPPRLPENPQQVLRLARSGDSLRKQGVLG